jgi:CRP/FNR family transcriptional regulator, cyclic AMP receptor protein
MAPSLATMTNTAPSPPLDIPFPLPPAMHHRLKIVATPASVLPAQGPAFDPQSPLNKFVPGKSRRDYLAGESIFSQGDTANAVFYLQSGNVKLTVVSSSGKEAIISQLTAGSYFGEASIAGEQQRASSANALQTSTIIRIEKTAMLDLLHRDPEFSVDFRAHLLSRNMRLQADLVDHLFNSSEKRLARLLMLMANFGQDSRPIPVIAKISQETLADMIGTTRSRVSFFLNRFRSLGYIDYNGGGMVINSSLINIVLRD